MADEEEVDPTNKSTPSAADPLGPEGDDRPADQTARKDSGSQSGEDHLLEEDFAANAPPIGGRARDEFADDERADDELVDDEPVDDERRGGEDPDGELVAVGAPSNLRSAGRGDAAADRSLARSKKDKPTPQQKVTVTKEKRTGPVTFLKESAGELRKVVYPTGQQLLNYFIVVLIFVLFIIAIVSLLDLAFGAATLKIFS